MDRRPQYPRTVPSSEERAVLLDSIETELAGVELALARLDAGTYDVCETCGATLVDELLAAAPTARRCADCG
jgi:RNA polymerase-binding transcription factor DksA